MSKTQHTEHLPAVKEADPAPVIVVAPEETPQDTEATQTKQPMKDVVNSLERALAEDMRRKLDAGEVKASGWAEIRAFIQNVREELPRDWQEDQAREELQSVMKTGGVDYSDLPFPVTSAECDPEWMADDDTPLPVDYGQGDADD